MWQTVSHCKQINNFAVAHCSVPTILLLLVRPNSYIGANSWMQGPMMLNVRRLTALTALRMIGSPNLTGHAPVAVQQVWRPLCRQTW
jgi:hypothetical protein